MDQHFFSKTLRLFQHLNALCVAEAAEAAEAAVILKVFSFSSGSKCGPQPHTACMIDNNPDYTDYIDMNRYI